MRASITKTNAIAVGTQWAQDRWKASDDAGRRGPPIFDVQWLPEKTPIDVVTAVVAAATRQWHRLRQEAGIHTPMCRLLDGPSRRRKMPFVCVCGVD